MDYETADGSRFSLLEIFDPDGTDGESFSYTSVAAYVGDNAYAGKVQARIGEIDDGDLLACLNEVPVENIHPLFEPSFTAAPQVVDSAKHYLKAPSFVYEDSLPGQHFVADCVLREINVYEHLLQKPHPHLSEYQGCFVRDGRVTRICLHKYDCSLVQYAESGRLTKGRAAAIFDEVLSAVKHLHGLGRAHNDINPHNVCIDAQGRAVVIDFDACLQFGERLQKGVGLDDVSSIENDWRAMDALDDYLHEALEVDFIRRNPSDLAMPPG